MEALVSFSVIVQALQQACAQAHTGRFHIVTSDNHKVTFILEQGVICGVSYRIKRGVAALEAVFKIESGRWRLEQTTVLPAPDSSLPDTRRILLKLSSLAEALPPQVAVTATPAMSTPDTSATPALAYLPASIEEDLIALLTQAIGPVASFIVPTTLATAPDAQTAVDLLTREIPDDHVANQFRQAVWDILNDA